jgi:hypothetical protein
MANNTTELRANNPNAPLRFDEDERLDALVSTLASALNAHDSRTEAATDDLYIESASGDALDLRGEAIGTTRRSDESDSSYRTRVQAAYAVALADTTITDFARIAQLVLDTDPSGINLTGVPGEPAITLRLDRSVLDETPLNESEILAALGAAIPSGHALKLDTTGTLELDGPNFVPSDNSGLSGPDTVGGTLGGTEQT